jgi:hypothetical protein
MRDFLETTTRTQGFASAQPQLRQHVPHGNAADQDAAMRAFGATVEFVGVLMATISHATVA